MAIKLLPEQKQYDPSQESILQTMGRTVKQAVAKPIEFLGIPGEVAEFRKQQLPSEQEAENAIKYLPKEAQEQYRRSYQEMAAPNPFPTKTGIRRWLEKQEGQKEGYLDPQNSVQQVIDWGANQVPWYFLTGASQPFAQFLGHAAGSALGAKTAEALGAGVIGQLAGSFAGGGLANFIQRGGRPAQFMKEVKKQEQINFHLAKEVGKDIKEDPSILNNGVKSILRSAEENLPESSYHDLIKETGTIANRLERPSVVLNDIWNDKKKLNNLIYSKKLSNDLYLYVEAMRDNLASYLEQAGIKYPNFGDPFQKAESLWRGLNLRSKIGELVESATGLEKTVPSTLTKLAIFGATGATGGLLGLGATVPLLYGANKAARAADFIAKSDHGRKILFDMIESAARDNLNPQKMATIIRQLNVDAKQYEHENPIQKPQQLKAGVKVMHKPTQSQKPQTSQLQRILSEGR